MSTARVHPKILAEGNSVTNIREDPATLTTFLTAQEASWADVAGNFDLDFGKAISQGKPLSRRILGPREAKQIDTTVDVSVGEPGNSFNILPGGRSYVALEPHPLEFADRLMQ